MESEPQQRFENDKVNKLGAKSHAKGRSEMQKAAVTHWQEHNRINPNTVGQPATKHHRSVGNEGHVNSDPDTG